MVVTLQNSKGRLPPVEWVFPLARDLGKGIKAFTQKPHLAKARWGLEIDQAGILSGVEIALGACEDRSVVAAGDLDLFHEVRNLDPIFKNEPVAELAHHPGLHRFDADEFDGSSVLFEDLLECDRVVDVVVYPDTQLVGGTLGSKGILFGNEVDCECYDDRCSQSEGILSCADAHSRGHGEEYKGEVS